MSLHRIAFVLVLALTSGTAGAQPTVGCGNFRDSPPTIAAERDAPNSFILVGHIENAQKTDTGGTTAFVIEKVLKPSAAVGAKKVIIIDRYVPIPDPKKPPRFVVFGTATNAKLDIYRGIPDEPGLVAYVEGLLKIETKDRAKLLRYAFDNIEPRGTEAAGDALLYWAEAPDAEVAELAANLDAGKLRKWLGAKDPDYARVRLYGKLLGYCGTAADAKLLRDLLDEPNNSGNDGPLIGLVLLDKKAGLSVLSKLVADPDREFVARYAGLRALRYFWDHKPEVLTRKEVLACMVALTEHADMADMPVEDFRKWKLWDQTTAVLKLAGRKEHMELPINRRAVLKFALAASAADPTNAAARAYVEKARKDDPERVKLLEEILKDEAAAERKQVAPPPGP